VFIFHSENEFLTGMEALLRRGDELFRGVNVSFLEVKVSLRGGNALFRSEKVLHQGVNVLL
jgi:hypothetical protein